MSSAVIDTSISRATKEVSKGGAFRIRYNPNRVAHSLNKLGLGYFSPFARLIGNDEPRRQLHEIAVNTLLPLAAFAGFILIWAILSQTVRTDSVKIPGPHQAYYALTGTAIPGLAHPFPENIEGLTPPYFATNEGRDPKSINGFAKAEEISKATYLTSRDTRVASFLEKAREASAAGEAEKAAKFKSNADVFASKQFQGNKTFYTQIWISLLTVAIGFLVATLIAVPIGVLCGISPKFNIAVNPLIQLFKPVSPLAWFPIVFVLTTWGIETPPSDSIWQRALWTSAGVVMLCSLWPTLINTAVGVASVDRDHLNVARVLKLGWFKRIRKIVLPASLPMIFTGLRLSIGVGWMVLIAADMMAQNQGLGKFVWDMYQNGDTMSTAQIIVAVFVIGIIGFFLDRVMLVFQRLVTYEVQSV